VVILLFAGKYFLIVFLTGILTIGGVGMESAHSQGVDAKQNITAGTSGDAEKSPMNTEYGKLNVEESKLKNDLEEACTEETDNNDLEEIQKDIRRVQVQKMVLRARMEAREQY